MKTFGSLALVLLGSAVCALAQDPALTSVSVAYQVNPAHTGSVQSTGVKPPLTVKWSVNLNGNASYPLILPGEVIVIDGGSPSTLEALNAADGSVLWSQPVASGYGGWVGAAYDNGMVFAVNYETPGFSSGSMSAFSASTGDLLWTASLPNQYQFTSPPTAKNGIVYTGGAGVGGTVYALKETNGDLLWTGSVENGDTSSPAISGTSVYVSYACPQTYRFNAKTGALLWHYSGACEGGGGDTAVVYKGVLYVRDVFFQSTSGLTFSTTTNAQIGGFNSQYAPAFSGTTVFYTESSTLTAVNITTGATLWTANATGGESFTCSPIVVNGIVYMGTSSGTLLGYTVGKGTQKVSMSLGQPISCSEYFVVPQAGMGAGQGMLVVPAGAELFALQ